MKDATEMKKGLSASYNFALNPQIMQHLITLRSLNLSKRGTKKLYSLMHSYQNELLAQAFSYAQ